MPTRITSTTDTTRTTPEKGNNRSNSNITANAASKRQNTITATSSNKISNNSFAKKYDVQFVKNLLVVEGFGNSFSVIR
jgi:hypothetical protein